MSHDLPDALWRKNFLVLFCRKETWHQRVDANVLLGPLACKVLGQVVNGSFCR